MKKAWISTTLSLLLTGVLVSSGAASAAQSVSSNGQAQTGKHWAQDIIEQWDQAGWIDSSDEKSFSPNAKTTRAEWIHWLNTAFSLESNGEQVSFTDIEAGSELQQDVSSAVNAGYITGFPDGSFKPEKPVTRQEAAAMAARLFAIHDDKAARVYTDASAIAAWSTDFVGAVTAQGFMQGANGKFRPQATITQAEAIATINRIVEKPSIVIDQAGSYGSTDTVHVIPKNVTIDGPDITLQNVKVNGDLVLGSGIGEGDVYLKGVEVTGSTTVQGGGEHSVHFENTIMVTVIVDKKEGTVRLVVEGKSKVGEIVVQTGARIEAETGSDVSSVTLSERLPEGSHVQLTGAYDTVNVSAQSIVVDIPKGSIDNLNVGTTAEGTQIITDKETAILSLVLNAAINVLGQGEIAQAVVNAEGVQLEQAPKETTVGKDVPADTKVTIGDKEQSATSSTTTADTNSNTSSNNSGSTNNGSSNNGSSNNGSIDNGSIDNGSINDKPADRTAPVITTSTAAVIYIGDTVFASSNEDGTIYIVPAGTIKTQTYLELAVQDGKGVSSYVTAEENAAIPTDWLEQGEYVILAVDAAGNASEEKLFYLSEGGPLKVKYPSMSYNTGYHFNFNQEIVSTVTEAELKAAITYSTDGGETFAPLGELDEIQIRNNRILIWLDQEYTGDNNVFKIAAGVLKSKDGEFINDEIVSEVFSAGTNLTVLTPTSLDAAADDVLTFQVDKPGTVYLVPDGTSGSKTDFENAIVNGKGLKYIVTQEDINKPLTFTNEELRTVGGIMNLLAWGGESVNIDLTLSATVQPEQVSMNNSMDDSKDMIKINGLQAGDVVRLYNYRNYNTVVAEAAVAQGEDSVAFGHIDAIQPGDTFFVTLQSAGRFEGNRLGLMFPVTNEAPEPIALETVSIPAEGIELNISELVSDPEGDPLIASDFSTSNPEVAAIAYYDGAAIKLERGAQSGQSVISFVVNDTNGHVTNVSFNVSWDK